MPPPIGYRWSDKEWKLDESGPWMDSILGIGKQHSMSELENADLLNWQSISHFSRDSCKSSSKQGTNRLVIITLTTLSLFSAWWNRTKMVGYTRITNGRTSKDQAIPQNIWLVQCQCIARKIVGHEISRDADDGIVQLQNFIKLINERMQLNFLTLIHTILSWCETCGQGQHIQRSSLANQLRVFNAGREWWWNIQWMEGGGWLHVQICTVSLQASTWSMNSRHFEGIPKFCSAVCCTFREVVSKESR